MTFKEQIKLYKELQENAGKIWAVTCPNGEVQEIYDSKEAAEIAANGFHRKSQHYEVHLWPLENLLMAKLRWTKMP